MLGPVHAMILSAGVAYAGTPCPENAISSDHHLEDVCAVWIEEEPAYAATFGASLTPRPASQQVLIYRREGDWFMRIAGFRWNPGGEVVTRRDTIAISDEDAETIVDSMNVDSLAQLHEQPFYGSDVRICTDGATYSLATAQAGRRYDARQHSCASKTELNATAALFRQLALKYDPAFEGLLYGLRD